jgi:hypothetical protein
VTRTFGGATMTRLKARGPHGGLLRFSTLVGVVGVAFAATHSCTRNRGPDPESPAPPGQEGAAPTSVVRSPVSGARILGSVRDIALRVARPHESLGLEGMANQMDPYLLGMIEMLRVVDEGAVLALRQALTDDICDNPSRQGIDLILLAKLVLIEPQLASPEALNCALERHSEEDFVLWSLLDAYNTTSREPLPSLAAIRESAKDERTHRRLAHSPSKRLAQASVVETQRSTRPGNARGKQ